MKTCTQLIHKLCGKWPLRQPPMIPSSWYSLPSEMWNSLLFPGETILLFLISRIQHRMSLLRCNYKKTVASVFGILSLSVSLFLCLNWRSPAATSQGSFVGEPYGTEPRAPDNQGSGIGCKYLPGKPSDDYSPIDILTATSWQTPSQKHSVKPFPNSWPTGVKGDNMFTHFHMSQHIIFSSTI